ncbi:4143_t:CDS:2 [Dentiscutata heterogama]|uniref:4143_t:CDS:1 n=1 Tax=Dentiscutata heterogama TaxID=1316150 RepID=A0ACA9KJN1_9GLOM|nr:4143_t:CDS:2 [Dentiscutata heterogama]
MFREEAGDPSSELVDKIKDWTYEDAPYIFVYYAIGAQVIFVALYKSKNKKRKLNICFERIAEFDLGNSPEFQTMIRPNRTIIELGYTIKKKFVDERRVTHLKEIYRMLSANNIRFSDKLEYASTHSVNLAPCGEQREPNDLKALLQALIYILTCLKPNIIRHYDRYQRFILIDFDYADFSSSNEPLEKFFESDHAPEILNKNFSTDLCKSNPNKQPITSVALDRVKDMFREFSNDDWLEKIETA